MCCSRTKRIERSIDKQLFIIFLLIGFFSCSGDNESIPPVLTSVTSSNVSYYSADINIEIEQGKRPITLIGVEYSCDEKTQIKEAYLSDSNNATIQLDNLIPNKQYNYIVYLVYDNNKIWGLEQSFKTLVIPQGVIDKLEYSNLTETGFTIKAKCSAPADFPILDFKFKVTEIENEQNTLEVTTDRDIADIANLNPNTYYRVKAFLTNEGGTVESSDLIVQTLTLKGKWKSLFGDIKNRFFGVYITNNNNLYFGLGTGFGTHEGYNDWNKFDGEKIISLAPFPGVIDFGRENNGFCIGNFIYIINFNKEVWCYDILNDKWTQKKNFDGASVTMCCFTYNGKGYYGFGIWGRSSLYSYDASNDTWERLKDCPERIDRGLFFQIDGFIYAGLGITNRSKVYRYSIENGTWDTVADFPGEVYNDVQCFSIGNKGYVAGGGLDGSSNAIDEVWEYNSFNDTWSKKTILPQPRRWGTGCNYGNYGIVANGGISTSHVTSTIYCFDPNEE